jgi:phosphate starvation-inducible PhoH-like protein
MVRRKRDRNSIVEMYTETGDIAVESVKRTRGEKLRARIEFLPDLKLTPKQLLLLETIKQNQITFITGPAGTSKTFLSCYASLQLLQSGEFEKIILTKPIRESGENLGFLPGTIEEKIDPFMESFYSNIQKLITKPSINILKERELIENKPLAYMRGINLDSSICLLDEAQNTTQEQLMLFITRLGKGSKMIIMGDTKQTDIALKQNQKEGLTIFSEIIKDVKGVAVFEFKKEDIMRNPILIEIVDRYEIHKYGNQKDKK